MTGVRVVREASLICFFRYMFDLVESIVSRCDRTRAAGP